ncbi:MAG TPA: DUF2946 family protein [Casimicrobiaceae bacterium]
MTRRFRLGIALAALAMHLLAPIGAYATVRPAVAFGDYCSTAARASLPSGVGAPVQRHAATSDSDVPAPQQHRHLHTHCASCLGASLAAAVPPSTSPFAVRPVALVAVPPDPVRARAASSPVLLPPLRGPPPVGA